MNEIHGRVTVDAPMAVGARVIINAPVEIGGQVVTLATYIKLVQELGDGLFSVMSQDAVTRLLQEKLVSGQNIKTVNNESLLGSGNIDIQGGGGTSDYDELSNKPQINGVELSGELDSDDLSLADRDHTHTVSDITDFPQLAEVATSGDYNDLENTPSIPTKISELQNDSGFVTASYHDTTKQDVINDLNTIRSGAAAGATAVQTEVDPTVPSWAKQPSKPSYNASEVGALPSSTKYGDAIDVSLNTSDYKLTITLKDQDGNAKTTKTVDFPIESVVVNGSYDSVNKKIVLTLQNGSMIDVPVGDLVAGLQTEITSLNMLDADLIDDSSSQNKFVTDNEKQTWNAKSDFSGSYNDLTDTPALAAVATSGDYSDLDNKPTIPSDTGDLTNGAGFITSADIPPIPNGTYIDIANAGWGPNQVTGAYLRAAYFYNGEVPNKVGDYVYSKSTRCLHKITSITQVGGENVANADFIAFFSGFDGSYNSLSGKPTLGTAAALNVPASGDAATTEVVKGDDSRLTDARTPTAHSHPVSEITDFPTLATVATSGSYNDLQDTPTIPSAPGTLDTTQTTAQSTNASEALSGSVKLHKVSKTGTYSDLIGTPSLAAVATSGDYDDLQNKPTIPDTVSGTNDGTNWTSITIGSDTYAIPSGGGGGGLSNYDFTELSAPTISGGACTITFVADQRNAVEFSTNADLSIALVSNNKADNYIWITNSHATTAIDITFSSILFGSTAINDIKGTASIPSVEAGETLEIGIYVTDTKARITSRIL